MKRLFLIIASFSLLLLGSCNPDNQKGKDTGNESGELVLTPSATSAVTGETVTFKVELDGKDVTAEAVIMLGNDKIEGNVWTAAGEGKYSFRAEYMENVSDEISIEVIKFRKKILLHKFTGAWCGFCPAFTTVLDEVDRDYPNQMEVISVHIANTSAGQSSDYLATLAGNQLDQIVNPAGYPAAWVDHREQISTKYQSVVNTLIKSQAEYPAVCGIKITTKVDGKNITADAEVIFDEDGGKYKICAVLLENDIKYEGQCTEPTGIYHHVLRQYATAVTGKDIGEQNKGSYKESFSFKAADSWNLDNCYVLVYVLKNYGNNYYVNNVEKCSI